MKMLRVFASERCPHCQSWLVGVKDIGKWWCTACGSQITDCTLIERMTRKAVFKEKEPGQWAFFDPKQKRRNEMELMDAIDEIAKTEKVLDYLSNETKNEGLAFILSQCVLDLGSVREGLQMIANGETILEEKS